MARLEPNAVAIEEEANAVIASLAADAFAEIATVGAITTDHKHNPVRILIHGNRTGRLQRPVLPHAGAPKTSAVLAAIDGPREFTDSLFQDVDPRAGLMTGARSRGSYRCCAALANR